MHAQRKIANIIIADVDKIWEKSSLPRVTHRRIDQMVKEYYNKYIAILRIPKRRQDSEKYQGMIKKFLEDSDKLFDICSCKCQPIESCTCEKSRKVPQNPSEFLIDQRGERLMMLAGVDKLESRRHFDSKLHLPKL